MDRKKIAVYGGSFNPFGNHHRVVVELLITRFDFVVIFPCGLRPDKATTNEIAPFHRGIITELSVADLPSEKVRVEKFDLERNTFTKNHHFDRIFGHLGELWHVVGTDLIQGGARGESSIHRWQYPDLVWNTLNFAVVHRTGYPIDPADLPPHSIVLNTDRLQEEASSKLIREKIVSGQSISNLMVPAAAAYVKHHSLYMRQSMNDKEIV